jgi:hypothetical protein
MIDQLTLEINALDEKLKASLTNTVQLTLELGGKLLAAKAELPHGQFQLYIEANCL